MEPRELPVRPSPKQYTGLATDLVKAYRSGDSEAMRRIRERYKIDRPLTRDDLRAGVQRRLSKRSDSKTRTATFALADARWIIAHEYGFENWSKFVKHLEGLAQKNSLVLRFESAADAIVDGDVVPLESLLRKIPALVRLRSTRVHKATLLHYVGANGVESYRQKSPKNAVQVMKILVEAGAEVDPGAEMYGGGATTLGLAATSVHAARAGVQPALIETLLDHGAAVDGLPGSWSPLMAALANHCQASAETLAKHGARVDHIIPAAALGRLDLVRS